jgi:hypothetical protein
MRKKIDVPLTNRVDSVYATVNIQSDCLLTLNYDFQTDQLEIVGADPGSSRTERRYERSSGKPKVVSSIPSGGPSAFDAKQALYAFDWALAVDTNSLTTGDTRYGVCFSNYAQMPPRGFVGNIVYRPLGAFLIAGIAEAVNPERIGWFLTIKHHLAAHQAHMGRIAVVVDSELGLHRAINSREVGYYEGHLMPDNITMVYASSDKDKETMQGVMLRACDRNSRRILGEFRSPGALPVLSPNSGDKNFAAFAKINFLRE